VVTGVRSEPGAGFEHGVDDVLGERNEVLRHAVQPTRPRAAAETVPCSERQLTTPPDPSPIVARALRTAHLVRIP
jgi:hypothetical protein